VRRKTRLAGLGSIAALSAGVLLTACSPVQIGAAAIVGNQRITEASLDSDVSNLQATASQHPSQVTITSAEMPSTVLNWLVQFQLYDKMASQAGITVTETDYQAEQKSLQSQVQGGSLALAVASIGVPPSLESAFITYAAQSTAIDNKVTGGKQVTTQAQENAAEAQLKTRTCSALTSLNVKVNPRYGQFTQVQTENQETGQEQAEFSISAFQDQLSSAGGSNPSAAPKPAIDYYC
jgi:hypothetical protein